MALMRDKEKIQLKSEAFVFLLKLFLVPAKYNVIIILLIKHIFHGWSYVQCRYLTRGPCQGPFGPCKLLSKLSL